MRSAYFSRFGPSPTKPSLSGKTNAQSEQIAITINPYAAYRPCVMLWPKLMPEMMAKRMDAASASVHLHACFRSVSSNDEAQVNAVANTPGSRMQIRNPVVGGDG